MTISHVTRESLLTLSALHFLFFLSVCPPLSQKTLGLLSTPIQSPASCNTSSHGRRVWSALVFSTSATHLDSHSLKVDTSFSPPTRASGCGADYPQPPPSRRIRCRRFSSTSSAHRLRYTASRKERKGRQLTSDSSTESTHTIFLSGLSPVSVNPTHTGAGSLRRPRTSISSGYRYITPPSNLILHRRPRDVRRLSTSPPFASPNKPTQTDTLNDGCRPTSLQSPRPRALVSQGHSPERAQQTSPERRSTAAVKRSRHGEISVRVAVADLALN
ncbi:hypothetical protein R3P38DRAFT_3605987 [Favolaschia claudopus]|uniref:Uncharacterized protein n=1 Tax=Favolaschia claudopus TaxID=2862362 RepID=A0AAW0DH08_9AGAR